MYFVYIPLLADGPKLLLDGMLLADWSQCLTEVIFVLCIIYALKKRSNYSYRLKSHDKLLINHRISRFMLFKHTDIQVCIMCVYSYA